MCGPCKKFFRFLFFKKGTKKNKNHLRINRSRTKTRPGGQHGPGGNGCGGGEDYSSPS